MSCCDASHAQNLVADVGVDRENILPIVWYTAARELTGDGALAIWRWRDGGVKSVLRYSGTVNILVKEPVHLAVPIQIHISGHVFFDDGLEVFGGSGLVIERLAIVLHGFLEYMIWIGGSRIHHLAADHLQYVTAFGVNQILIGSGIANGCADALAHPDRTELFCPVTIQVRFEEKILIEPELCEGFLHALAILHVQQSGEFRESFREPLVMIAFPAHSMTPPLVGAFVCAKKIGDLSLVLKPDFVALGRIEKSEPRQIQQSGPTLAIAARNTCNGKRLVGIRPIVALKHL